MKPTLPDISIIVPLLNEAGELEGLFSTLAGQRGIRFELILCDGGSDDGTQKTAEGLSAGCGFPVKLIQTERGRGKQMNAGAAAATADLLLFLHADSRFEEQQALLNATQSLRSALNKSPEKVAARFGLNFRRSQAVRSLAFFFYEAKARLPRLDCIRGDQGFLMDRKIFTRVGGFDESLPFLEDLRLVADTSSQLQWQLLPSTISTSARRFEREGLLERQILNAIIVNNIQAGWIGFFESLPGLYRSHCHSSSGRLLLLPILDGIDKLLKQSSAEWQRHFWRSTGQHVAANAWQLFYWLDTRRTFLEAKKPQDVQPHWLDFYQRRLKWLFQSRSAAFLAQTLVRLWLKYMLIKETRQKV